MVTATINLMLMVCSLFQMDTMLLGLTLSVSLNLSTLTIRDVVKAFCIFLTFDEGMKGSHFFRGGVEISLSKRQSVSEFVYLCVWMFPNSSETANPSELKF